MTNCISGIPPVHLPVRRSGDVTDRPALVRHIGEGFHINLLDGSATYLAAVDADRWKSSVHQRLATPMGQPGGMRNY